MLKLKSIFIRNWLSITEDFIEFPEKGLISVSGKNCLSSEKFESIGSGKTALGEAVCRTLFGVGGRYKRLNSYSKNDKGNTYIKLTAQLNNGILEIELGYKCKELSKTGEAFRYRINEGEYIQRSRIEETRQDLLKIIGIGESLSQWTVHVDGDKLDLESLSEENTVSLIMESLDQPLWSEYKDKAQTLLSSLKDEYIQLEASINANNNLSVKLNEDIESINCKIVEEKKNVELLKIEAEKKKASISLKIKDIEDKKEAIQKKLSQFKVNLREAEELEAVEFKDLEHSRLKLNSAKNEILEEIKKCNKKILAVRVKKGSSEKELLKLKNQPKNCPTCGKPFDKCLDSLSITGLEEELNVYSSELLASEVLLSDNEADLDEINNQIKELEVKICSLKAVGKVESISKEIEHLQTEVQSKTYELKSLNQEFETASKIDTNNLDRLQTLLIRDNEQLDSIAKEIEKAKEQLLETVHLQTIAKFWNDAFSPRGIPNMIISESIQALNCSSNIIARQLTSGAINVKYSNSMQLKNGEEKAGITVAIENKHGSSNASGSSKGESGLINLIVSETLSNISRMPYKIGFKWLDEVSSGQDELVRKSIFSYLKDIANRLNLLILIVDHSPEISNYADKVLTAVKTENGTKFEWC